MNFDLRPFPVRKTEIFDCFTRFSSRRFRDGGTMVAIYLSLCDAVARSLGSFRFQSLGILLRANSIQPRWFILVFDPENLRDRAGAEQIPPKT